MNYHRFVAALLFDGVSIMSLWNKILIVIILLLALPAFFYMSARMLKIQKYWGDLSVKYEAKIKALEEDTKAKLAEIHQVRAELANLNIDRQRVWYNCDPKVSLDRKTGSVSIKINIDQPKQTGVVKNSILYVFESAPATQKGRYLGKYKVTAVSDTDKQITLEPAFKLTQTDLDKLASEKAPWNLYDSLPHDNHWIFAQLNEQDKKAWLPADIADEYLKDEKNERQLIDYSYLFDEYRFETSDLIDQIEATDRDLKLAEDSLADAKKQVEFYEKQATIAKTIFDKFARQKDTVNDYLVKLNAKIAEIKSSMESLIKNNKAMAGQIAKIQLDATRRIDERTRAMAQSANGNN